MTVALKNGFAVIDGWQINTEGWVHGDGHNYLIGVLTNDNASESYGIDTVNAVSAIVWRTWRTDRQVALVSPVPGAPCTPHPGAARTAPDGGPPPVIRRAVPEHSGRSSGHTPSARPGG